MECMPLDGFLSFRFNKIKFWPELCPRPCWGAYDAPSDLLVGWGTPSPFPTTSTPYLLHTFGHLTLDAFGIFEAWCCTDTKGPAG